jgi:hypothetical protein
MISRFRQTSQRSSVTSDPFSWPIVLNWTYSWWVRIDDWCINSKTKIADMSQSGVERNKSFWMQRNQKVFQWLPSWQHSYGKILWNSRVPVAHESHHSQERVWEKKSFDESTWETIKFDQLVKLPFLCDSMKSSPLEALQVARCFPNMLQFILFIHWSESNDVFPGSEVFSDVGKLFEGNIIRRYDVAWFRKNL